MLYRLAIDVVVHSSVLYFNNCSTYYWPPFSSLSIHTTYTESALAHRGNKVGVTGGISHVLQLLQDIQGYLVCQLHQEYPNCVCVKINFKILIYTNRLSIDSIKSHCTLFTALSLQRFHISNICAAPMFVALSLF